jgi:hypothetical protein
MYGQTDERGLLFMRSFPKLHVKKRKEEIQQICSLPRLIHLLLLVLVHLVQPLARDLSNKCLRS